MHQEISRLEEVDVPQIRKEKYFFELEVVVYVPEIQKLFMELLRIWGGDGQPTYFYSVIPGHEFYRASSSPG